MNAEQKLCTAFTMSGGQVQVDRTAPAALSESLDGRRALDGERFEFCP